MPRQIGHHGSLSIGQSDSYLVRKPCITTLQNMGQSINKMASSYSPDPYIIHSNNPCLLLTILCMTACDNITMELRNSKTNLHKCTTTLSTVIVTLHYVLSCAIGYLPELLFVAWLLSTCFPLLL